MNDHGNCFVDAPGAKETYGRDIHCHGKVLSDSGGELEGGDLIAFNVHVSAQGHPQVSLPVWKAYFSETWFTKGGGGGQAKFVMFYS